LSCCVQTVSGVPSGGGGGGSSDPPLSPTLVRLLDDFYTDIQSFGGGGANALVPDLGWVFVGTGAPGSLLNLDAEPGHPGILRQSIGAGQLVRIDMGDASGGGTNPLPVAPGTDGGPYLVEWMVRLNQVATGPEPFDYIAGLHRRPARPNELTWPRACFRADSSSGNWLCETHQAATTQTDSGVAISLNWQALRVEANTDWDSIDFLIDGVVVATHATNLPTDTLSPCTTIRDVSGTGVTVRSVDVDYAYFEYQTTRPT